MTRPSPKLLWDTLSPPEVTEIMGTTSQDLYKLQQVIDKTDVRLGQPKIKVVCLGCGAASKTWLIELLSSSRAGPALVYPHHQGQFSHPHVEGLKLSLPSAGL